MIYAYVLVFRYECLLSDQSHQKIESKKLELECIELEKQLKMTRVQHDEEKLHRISIESENRMLKDEIAFRNEAESIFMQRHDDMKKIDNQMHQEYELRLLTEIKCIKKEAEQDINQKKELVEKPYFIRLKEVESSLRRSQAQISAFEEMRDEFKAKNDELIEEIKANSVKIISQAAKIKGKLLQNHE